MNAVVLLALTAAAADRDYSPEHSGWNGLSEWCDLARAMGLTIEAAAALDVDSLDPSVSTLVLLSPRSPVDPAPVLRFLHRGGRVLIADDFGRSDSLWTALGMERAKTPATPPTERYRDNPQLPIARPASAGPLTDGVDRVVTNHPAVLRSRLAAALAFSSPIDAVAIAAEIPSERGGAGRFVALSDPSLLINNMLAFEGNLAFARNLLAWLARPGGHLVVMAGDVELRGRRDRPAGERPGLADLRREFNDFCVALSAVVPPRGLLVWLGAALCASMALVLLPVLRLPRRPPDGPFVVRR